MPIRLKRAYDEPAGTDGLRVLVERLWPRGLTRDKAQIDVWAKDVAPSAGLRRWYQHDESKWPEFRRRYLAELDVNEEAVLALQAVIRKGPVTFVFGSRETKKNSAVVLKGYLERKPLKRRVKRST